MVPGEGLNALSKRRRTMAARPDGILIGSRNFFTKSARILHLAFASARANVYHPLGGGFTTEGAREIVSGKRA